MPISVDAIAPGNALDALAGAVRESKAGRPLTPVTVIVPTNTAGVMARRALGRRGGVAAVDMLTLYRLAELIGSPALVAAGRSPVSTAVVDLAIRRVLAEAPGSFEPVAEHPAMPCTDLMRSRLDTVPCAGQHSEPRVGDAGSWPRITMPAERRQG